MGELGTQLFEADDVGIQAAPSDLIATGARDERFFKTREHGPGQHDRAAEPSAFSFKIVAAEVVEVDIISLEGAGVPVYPLHLYIHFLQQIDQVIYIKNVRDVADGDFVAG